MKRFLLILMAVCLYLLPVKLTAQATGRSEKMEAIKTAYLTRKMDLTPAEAQVFWPVYNDFMGKMETLRKSKNQYAHDNWINLDQMNDAELDRFMAKMFDYESQEAAIKENYYHEFRKVLPAAKVVRYFKAEQDFKLWVVKQARQRRQQQSGGNMGHGNKPSR